MKLPSLDRPVTSAWLNLNGRRLDSSPYVSGAIEAKVQLETLHAEKVPLKELTTGHSGGIYNGPQFVRNYVDSEDHGVPFLTSGTMLLADLSRVPLLRKKDALSPKLSYLRLEEGMTLISCSGTIGRMVYAGPSVTGMWSSQDILKVVPDPDKILPGYLYAYLSSRFGVPQVIGGTYGTIIQHIEPHHIADLPVPRLGKEVEEEAHQCVDKAAKLRSEASAKFREAGRLVNEHFGFPEKIAFKRRSFSTTVVWSSAIRDRLDATFHDVVAQESDRLIDSVSLTIRLGNLNIDVGEVGRMKLLFVDEEYGVPFLTSREIFRQRYEPPRYIAKRLIPDIDSWTVKEGDLLLARSGQIGGIIGRGVWADRRFNNACVSVDVLRLRVTDRKTTLPGYLFAYLFLTDVGYRQFIRIAAGSSIPHLSVADVLNVRVPRTTIDIEQNIDRLVHQAGELQAVAQEKEEEARSLIEEAIQKGVG